MSLHEFAFDGKIIRQKSGGSIGLDLTGVVADIYICHWDELFKQKLLDSQIIMMMYKRYKDDMNFAAKIQQKVGKNIKNGRTTPRENA